MAVSIALLTLLVVRESETDTLPVPPIEKITELQQTVLLEIGTTLCLLQAAEEAVSFCTSFIEGSICDSEQAMRKLNARHRKKTLGQLIHAIRQHTEVDDGFDSILSSFLQERNSFIHGMFVSREYHIFADETACEKALAFLLLFQQRIFTVKSVFMNYIVQINTVTDVLDRRREAVMKKVMAHFYGEATNPLNIDLQKRENSRQRPSPSSN